MNRLRWVQGAQAVLITIVVFGAGLVLLGLVILQLHSGDADVTWIERVRNYMLVAVWLLVSLYGSLLLRRIFRVSGRRALALDGRPPILYLREFRTDSVEAMHMGPTTNEQVLVSVLDDLGPVVALGRPGEGIRPLGSIRLYAVPEGDGWKADIERMIDEARFVVVEAGTSESLAWECHAVVDRASPDRVMISFLTWWREPRERREQRFADFRSATAALFPRPLPTRLDETVFLMFAPDWTPVPTPLRSRAWSFIGQTPLSAGGLREVLREPLRQRGMKVGWMWTMILAVAFPVALGVGIFVAVAVPWYFLSGEYQRDRIQEQESRARLDSILQRYRNLPPLREPTPPVLEQRVPPGDGTGL